MGGRCAGVRSARLATRGCLPVAGVRQPRGRVCQKSTGPAAQPASLAAHSSPEPWSAARSPATAPPVCGERSPLDAHGLGALDERHLALPVNLQGWRQPQLDG